MVESRAGCKKMRAVSNHVSSKKPSALHDDSRKNRTTGGSLVVCSGLAKCYQSTWTTFIIGTDGVVKKIFTEVDVLIHGEEVVAALQAGIGS